VEGSGYSAHGSSLLVHSNGCLHEAGQLSQLRGVVFQERLVAAVAAESLLLLLLAVGLGFAPALEVLALTVGAAEGSGHLSHTQSIGIQGQQLKDHYHASQRHW